MEKKVLKSDQEYFDYCVENTIGVIGRKYGSQCSCVGNDGDSVVCSYYHTYDNDSCPETIVVERKPKKYPCVLCWMLEEGDNDIYRGAFVYPEDFNQ